MTKFLKGAIFTALFLAGASAASAATTQTFLTLDGLSNNTYTVGSSFNAKLSFDLTGMDTLQSIKWEILNAANQNVLPFECQDVDPDFLTTGSYASEFTGHTMGGSQGTWKVRVSTYGVAVPGANNNCTGVPVSTKTYTNVLTLVNNNSTGSIINNTGTGFGGTNAGHDDSQMPAWFTAWLATQPHPATTTPSVPLPVAACTTLSTKMMGTVMNTYNPQNSILQGFLIGEGMSIPWLTDPRLSAGVPFGYFGVQTQAAVAAYKLAHGCV